MTCTSHTTIDNCRQYPRLEPEMASSAAGLSDDRVEPSCPTYEELFGSSSSQESLNSQTENGSRCQSCQNVCDTCTQTDTKKKNKMRKAKKAGGWAFNIALFPVALLVNGLRDKPRDKEDPYDWNNDPLRPWNYKVSLPNK